MDVYSDIKIDPQNYHEAAFLALTMGEQMLGRLDWMALQPKRIVDMGCGTGHHTPFLKKRYPKAEQFGLDYSFERLQFAKKTYSDIHTHWLCTDVLHLPFPDHSVDLIIANFILPWCHSLESTLREWQRVLTKDGLLMLTTLGPDTLREFKIESIQPQLLDMHHIGDALIQGGFKDPVMDVDHLTLRYKNSEKLLRELCESEMLKDGMVLESGLSVTYEIIFGHAFAKGPVEDEESVFKIPVHMIIK